MLALYMLLVVRKHVGFPSTTRADAKEDHLHFDAHAVTLPYVHRHTTHIFGAAHPTYDTIRILVACGETHRAAKRTWHPLSPPPLVAFAATTWQA